MKTILIGDPRTTRDFALRCAMTLAFVVIAPAALQAQTDAIIACDEGDVDACMEAAAALRNLPIPDRGGAVEMEQAACNLGNMDACTSAAVALIEGDGVEPDPERALTYLTEACNTGTALACFHAAGLFATGTGTDADSALAIRLLNIACEADVDQACSHRLLAASEAVADFEFIRVEAGTFMMGTPDGSPYATGLETLHEVTLTRPFEVAATEIPQGLYTQLIGVNPTRFSGCGDTCAQDMLNYWEAIRVVNALSEAAGLPACYELQDCSGTGELTNVFICQDLTFVGPDCEGYRIPTDAEWEYAARAGTTTTYSCGESASCLPTHACYGGDSPCPVASFEPNDWGLYDTLGNMAEWVHGIGIGRYSDASAVDPSGGNPDFAQHNNRVIRGGSFEHDQDRLRSAYRATTDPDVRYHGYGVRPVRTLPE